jgi:CHAD domain-containing protein
LVRLKSFDSAQVLFYHVWIGLVVAGKGEGEMEVEAKFTIPDRDTLTRLQGIVRLGTFVPGKLSVRQVHDRYLDTASRSLYDGGYACRFRRLDEQHIVTIKGLGEAVSGIHQRVEIEFTLPAEAGTDPRTWPEGEARDLVLSLIEDAPLEGLFTIEQTRHVRTLHENGRLVGELSIDQVDVQVESRHQVFHILEVELAPDGTIEDLHALIEHLTETWGLAPELRSKFDLGIALLDQAELESEPDLGRISAVERAQLAHIVELAPSPAAQERARLILGWGAGTPVRELLAQLGRSKSWGYGWIARFRAERTAIFSPDLLTPYEVQRTPGTDVQDVGDALEMALLPLDESMTIAGMCEHYQVDMAHARCVADHALALFDALASVHRLSVERRRLLEVMGILHNVGLETDPDRHHTAGRDIILQHPLRELSQVEQRMLAAAVYLHRKRIKPKRLKARVVSSLPPGIRSDALAMAALLRIADGLDYSQGQTTVLDAVDVTPAMVQVSVCGPLAEIDAPRAEAKADLWEHLFDIPLTVAFDQPDAAMPGRTPSDLAGPGLDEAVPPAPQVAPPSPAEPVARTEPGILPDDAMSEAGRKVLSFHFARMLEHEPGTRAGEDIEELHDMRVATRRMRAAFRVFGPYFKAGEIRPYASGLRRTARTLGQVRDLDVFVQKAQRYLGALPPENAHDLDPLLEVWRQGRRQARKSMIDYLDGDRYQGFVQAFQAFLHTPGAGARKMKGFPPKATRVRHVVPRLIYARWEQVQAFDPLLEGAPVAVLHALRVECKRLRYALEFFREVLGPEVKEVIAQVVQLQDHLGDLHDADVANALLSDFLFTRQGDVPSERVIAPGVVAYLAVKQRELQTLIDTFPQAWEAFNCAEVRHWLALSVAVL